MSREVENWVDSFYALNPDANRHAEPEKKVKEYKNDLFGDILPALDRRDKKFYSTLNEEQKKDISIWTLTRWMSSIARGAEDQLLTVNQVANKDSNILGSKKASNSPDKHKELQWMLLAICGTGKMEKHVWPSAPKGVRKSLLEEALIKLNPLMKDDELELLLKVNTREELEDYFRDNALDDKTIKELFKSEDKGK